MSKPLIQIFFFIIAACSCANRKTDIFINKDVNITAKHSLSDSIYMRYPFRIHQKDSLIYIIDLHGLEYFCQIYSYPEFKYLGSRVKRGSGPDEFTDAENVRTDSKGNFYILDANLKKIVGWSSNISDTLKTIQLSDKLIRTLDFAWMDDSTLIVPDYTGKYRYSLINCSGEILRMSQHIPALKKENKLSDIALAQAWRSFIDYNPTNGVLAVATQLGHVLEIYDVKADTLIKTLYGEYGEPEFIGKGGYAVPNGIMGYGDVHVTNNKIYALFWGRSFKDIRNNPDITEGGNQIEVYDLKGQPIVRYKLDKYITGFCVDEENNKILALDINSDKPIVEYSFGL